MCGPVFCVSNPSFQVVNEMEISTLIQKDSSSLKAPTVVLCFPYIASPLDTKAPVILTNTPAAPRLHRRGGQGIFFRIQVSPLPQIFYSSTKLNVSPTQYAVLQKSATHKRLVEVFGFTASPGRESNSPSTKVVSEITYIRRSSQGNIYVFTKECAPPVVKS